MIHPGVEALLLPSPISVEMSAMRLSLWTGLLATVVYNQNRQQNRVRIFESGLRFVPDTPGTVGHSSGSDVSRCGFAVTVTKSTGTWQKRPLISMDLKGDLESVLDLTGKLNEVEFRAEANPALHPGQSAAIYLKGERIGFVGVVHPELERKLDLNGRTLGVRTGVEQARRPRGASGARDFASRRTVVTSRWWSQKTFPQRIFYPNVRKLA